MGGEEVLLLVFCAHIGLMGINWIEGNPPYKILGGFAMPDQVLPGLTSTSKSVKEAVCIHTKRIFDACKDKDCIENLRMYPTKSSLEAINCSTGLTGVRGEIICVSVTVHPAPYSPGYYTLTITYYYKIFAETAQCGCTGRCVTGLAIFEKKSVLCGGTGGTKVFSSRDGCRPSGISGAPEAVVEALDPVLLDIKVLEPCCPCPRGDSLCSETDLPEAVQAAFGEELEFSDEVKRVFVSLGQFSIIYLQRDTQLLIPVYDNCVPEKTCAPSGTNASPCDLFSQIRFPTSLFYPEKCSEDGSGPVCSCQPVSSACDG